jgi:hypothetical protein
MENHGILKPHYKETNMKQSIASLALARCTLMVTLLSGCVFPHTSARSPEVRGRVLDARTHAPVEGVAVYFHDHRSTSCKTDSTGHFHLASTRNIHLVYGPAGVDSPTGTYYDELTVEHPSYVPLEIVTFGAPIGDILLKPKR